MEEGKEKEGREGQAPFAQGAALSVLFWSCQGSPPSRPPTELSSDAHGSLLLMTEEAAAWCLAQCMTCMVFTGSGTSCLQEQNDEPQKKGSPLENGCAEHMSCLSMAVSMAIQGFLGLLCLEGLCVLVHPLLTTLPPPPPSCCLPLCVLAPALQ